MTHRRTLAGGGVVFVSAAVTTVGAAKVVLLRHQRLAIGFGEARIECISNFGQGVPGERIVVVVVASVEITVRAADIGISDFSGLAIRATLRRQTRAGVRKQEPDA